MVFKLLSFNLRVDLESDGIHAFSNRKSEITRFLNWERYDLLGFQEVRPKMKAYLDEKLFGYYSIGGYRKKDEEAVPIYYLKSRFALLEERTFWLSDTPEKESKFEDSAYARIATCGVFRDLASQRVIIYLNAHLDFSSDETAIKQLKVIIEQKTELQKKYSDAAVILSGDFNMIPSSQTIRFAQSHFSSAYDENLVTYHQFTQKIKGKPIDYIFYQNIDSQPTEVIHPQMDIILSDHYPIANTFLV